MIRNKKILLGLFLILPMLGCAQIKDTNKNEVEKVYNKWQQATYASLNDSLSEIIQAGADSLSVMQYTLPIFKNYITDWRSECFHAFKDKGFEPFIGLYSSDLLVVEILREDHSHTKVMHIIDEKTEKKYSFVRSHMTDNKTNVYEEAVSDTAINFIEEFVSDFNYKRGWRSYTGVITYIKKGNFNSIPLLYLSEADIKSLNSYELGLQ